MKKNLKWLILLIASGLLLLIYFVYLIFGVSFFREGPENTENFLDSEEEVTEEFADENFNLNPELPENPLPIPQLLEDQNPAEGKAEFNLNVQYGEAEFIEGYQADTLGYNGNYLGPVIRVNRGDDVAINVENELNESTTVHWHGLEVIGEMDGGPHQRIDANDSWKPEFTIDQPAATLWYHPHLMNTTGEQVYKGLAGLFYIEDEYSESLDIPKDYGVNDIPLIVQDKRFTQDGQIPYNLTMPDQMNGFMGNTILINGAINPELTVKNEIIRLRILNGSNARSYDFNFKDGTEFYQIASDGGFLEESIPMNHLVLAPAERAEILVDLSSYRIGDQLRFNDVNDELMTITITEESEQAGEVLTQLVEVEKYQQADVVHSREFVMSGAGPMVAINGKQMDMDRIDEYMNIGELEEWFVYNEPTNGMGNRQNNQNGRGMMGNRGMMGGMHSSPHPFHVHGAQFQIVERNGEAPPLNERGWKDTVMLQQGEEVRLLVKFNKEGLFMYHCHILEHEDAGMMGQFLVE